MNQKISDEAANEIHSVSTARVFCHLRNRNCAHWARHLKCVCFDC